MILLISGQAIVIPPLQTIQMQMAATCESWEIPYLNLSDINPSTIAEKVATEQPKVLLSSIEDISNCSVQAQLQCLRVAYVAVDECQVTPPRQISWENASPVYYQTASAN